ncbi:MAG: hypothetical protein U9R40_06130, partial [Synergistota bacterium]|nr:hypothetical protein [Synergistota bacterium]
MKNTGWAQGLFEISSSQKEILGSLRIEPDGRKFRYSLAGEGLSVGKMSFMGEATANHINKSVAAAVAIGETEVQVTVGATAVTADQYKDGYLHVNDGTGQGHAYGIDTNTACDSSGTTIVTLKDPIVVALVGSATSEVSLIKNPWSGVTQSTTEESGSAGIPLKAITDAYYFWCQTGGPAICLASDTSAMGVML